jgi:hypothetical protein
LIEAVSLGLQGAAEAAKDMPGIFETTRLCPGWAYAEDTVIELPG